MKNIKDKLIPQNHPDLNENIRVYGCRFRTLQAIAECWMGKALTIDQIKYMYDWAIQDPHIMETNCACGKKENLIIDKAFELLGSDLKGLQIGAIDPNGMVSYWDEKIRGFDYLIDRWTTPTGYHFVLVSLEKDHKGNNIFWNPWSIQYDKKLSLKKITQKLIYRVCSF